MAAGRLNKILNKRILIQEYIKNIKSAKKIAIKFNCCKTSIQNYLKKFNIKTRTTSESGKGKYNGNFKGGFRKCKCGNLLKNYQPRVKMCRECYRKFIKNPRNNPNFGRLSQPIKRIYYKEICMRSSYETKFAYFLDCSGHDWLYESKTFDLGNTTYTPDFYLPKFNCYIEIKGWFHGKCKEKFLKFKKIYPKINIKLLMQKELQEIGIIK